MPNWQLQNCMDKLQNYKWQNGKDFKGKTIYAQSALARRVRQNFLADWRLTSSHPLFISCHLITLKISTKKAQLSLLFWVWNLNSFTWYRTFWTTYKNVSRKPLDIFQKFQRIQNQHGVYPSVENISGQFIYEQVCEVKTKNEEKKKTTFHCMLMKNIFWFISHHSKPWYQISSIN